MASTRLSSAVGVTRGYGQVEPNHLSAQRTGQIYAQLPAKADIKVLENGQFVKYNYSAGVVDFEGAGEWMLVYNEVKVYAPRETDADFAMIKDNYVASIYNAYGDAMPVDTAMVPRVFKTNVGDIYTTNCVNAEISTLTLGDILSPAEDGFLKVGEGDINFEVVKVYTLGDGQPAVKLMRIK